MVVVVVAAVAVAVAAAAAVVVIFPAVLWHCWLGGTKSIQPVKIWVLVCWW